MQDAKQEVWCLAELDKTKEEAKVTEEDLGDQSSTVDGHRGSIETMTAEIDAVKKRLEDMDESSTEGTEQLRSRFTGDFGGREITLRRGCGGLLVWDLVCR